MLSNDISLESERKALESNYILVLTTNSVEKDEVCKGLLGVRKCDVPFMEHGCRIGLLGERFIVVANGDSGVQKDGSIGFLANHFLTTPTMPRPNSVAIVGFAWGNPKKTSIGDVIVSNEIWSINHQQYAVDRPLYRRYTRVSSLNLEDALNLGVNQDKPYRLLHGPLLSAAIYYGDTLQRDIVLSEFPMALGGEMEAFATIPLLNDLPWLVIKGVSDFGNEDNLKCNQPVAAAHAVDVLRDVIPLLRDVLPLREDEQTARLLDKLLQQGISISAMSIKDQRHAYLNDVIAPALCAKLEQYSPDDDPAFTRRLTNTILEIFLNAVHHGDAQSVDIRFNETSLILEDDGRPFSPSNLLNGRGGTHAWAELCKAGIDRGILQFSEKSSPGQGNIYKFQFTRRDRALRLARERCTLRQRDDDHKPFPSRHPFFDFDPKCEYSYLDVSRVYMSSAHFGIIGALAPVLNSGHGIFVACDNETEARIYKDCLSDYAGPKLRVFVKSRV